MRRLSPEAGRIVDAGRTGDEPGAGDRQRIRHSLLAKVGAELTAGSLTTSAGTSAAAEAGAKAGLLASLLPKSVMVFSAVGAIGLGAYATRPSPAPSSPPAAATPTVSQISNPGSGQGFVAIVPAESAQMAPVEPKIAEQAAPALTPSISVPVSSVPKAPWPANEVETLREAHTALQEGRAEEALEVLEQNRTVDGSGLTQERAAIRVFALCKLGKQAQAQQAANAFLAAWPTPPLAARVAASCHP